MAQRAKQWLRKRTPARNQKGHRADPSWLSALNSDGGIAGSLVGLEYLERRGGEYRITPRGIQWVEGTRRGQN